VNQRRFFTSVTGYKADAVFLIYSTKDWCFNAFCLWDQYQSISGHYIVANFIVLVPASSTHQAIMEPAPAVATKPRPTPWYKVCIYFEIQATKGLLQDHIIVKLIPAKF
jgi:hypothetical protein